MCDLRVSDARRQLPPRCQVVVDVAVIHWRLLFAFPWLAAGPKRNPPADAEGPRRHLAALYAHADRQAGQPLAPTERQIEVLRAYVLCGSHSAASIRLGLSTRTVQAHLAALRSRLGVHNEAQAVYVLWLGYRDHLAQCGAVDHQACVPRVPV